MMRVFAVVCLAFPIGGCLGPSPEYAVSGPGVQQIIGDQGPAGILLTTSNTMGMPPTTTPSQTVSGLGQFGSAWLPPSSLARLERGQKLDSDPITGVTVTVSDVKSGQVIITASSAAQTTKWGYDRQSGLLNLIEKQDHNVFAPISNRMNLVRG